MLYIIELSKYELIFSPEKKREKEGEAHTKNI